MKIQHLGIVVTNLDESLLSLGLSRDSITETVHDPNQNNNLHFIFLKENDLWLELVEPLSSNSSVANFAKKNGMGLHHLAMSSDNLIETEKAYSKLEGAFVLGRYSIHVNSFGGDIKTLFIAVKGLILEFVKKT